MKLTTAMLTAAILLAFAIVTRVSSDEGNERQLAAEVQELRKEVADLQQQVRYLMTDHQFLPEDIEALTRRVENSKKLQERTRAIFQEGGPVSNEAIHQTNLALRRSQAELALARREFDDCLQHLDSAVAAAKMYHRVIQNRFAAGTVSLDAIVQAEETLIDTELYRNRMQQKVAIIANAPL